MLRWLSLVVVVVGCKSREPVGKQPTPVEQKLAAPADAATVPDPWSEARLEMVDKTIVQRGVTDERVVTAMRITPRHEFVPPAIRHKAYDDSPLPIGFDKTISQAFIVATMTEAARVKPGDKVLEIGTGSGYQAAVLAMMGAKVYTMEIHEELAARTRLVLERLGYRNVQLKVADGFYGWPDAAPFDAILVTCAAPDVPKPLFEQLKVGGRMVIPIGVTDQSLEVVTRTATGQKREPLMDVRFGPMIGAINNE